MSELAGGEMLAEPSNAGFIERSRCPVCRSASAVELHRAPFSDPGLLAFLSDYYSIVSRSRIAKAVGSAEYVVSQCAGCSLLFQRWAPIDGLASEIYDRWIIEDDPLGPKAGPLPRHEYLYLAGDVGGLIEWHRSRVGDRRRLKVLDFGMGWGNWIHFARAFGADVYGSELSDAKREHARRCGVPLVELHELRGAQFDVIAAEQVLEHVADPRSIGETLAGALRPGGVLRIGVPPSHGVRSRISSWRWDVDARRGRELMPIHPLEHLQCFTPRSLREFGSCLGLRRVTPPLRSVLDHSMGFFGLKSALKNFARPVYRLILKAGGHALYERPLL